MQTVLKNFITKSLFVASAEMLSQLHIKFSPQSKAPITFGDIYFGATSQPMPKQLSDVMDKVKETFFIGTIDEESLKGHQSSYDLEKPVEGKYQTMMVFAVDIKQGETLTRTELAILTRGFNRMASSLPVILFIRNGNKLSLATCERSEYRQNWRDGEKLGKVSILRDINLEHPHRGHLDILGTLGDKAYPTFDELYKHWLAVFSSELLTKKFYTELSEWYAWVIGSGEVKFPNDISTTEDDMKYNHEAVIRLITRLIFVWFLKQKKLIPEEFFDEAAIRENFIENFDPHSDNTLFYDPRQSRYYRLILQNLFFAMLNRPIKDEESENKENRRFVSDKRYHGIRVDRNINNLLRYKSEFKDGGAEKLLALANSQVPFLNGGLFECLDHKDKEDPEYGMYYDGFTENTVALKQLSFPDYFFFGEKVGEDVDLSAWYGIKGKHSNVRGLIDILKRYNFTVEENTPLDQEVSLDPELLGKVFENLLASYNPETNTTARKQTGSFYTPRPIVQYMIDESLIAYLKRLCTNISEETIRNLFDYSDENLEISKEDREEIISALYACKVLDPACGSGAYPMGILQQMVHVLRKLDPSNEMWKDFILEVAVGKDKDAYKNSKDKEELEARRRDIEEAFNRNVNDPDYARKLYLIENCIYGVDIQPIATQISKLRFFISLVSEQKPTSDALTNFGIRPLPNLEAKIVAANSLIPLGQGNLFSETEGVLKLKKELAEENHKLFIAKRNAEKRKIKARIREIRKEYLDELLAVGVVDGDNAMKLAKWDMFEQNDYAKFFDSQWMFGFDDGFDIVIGNPPYIQLQKATGEKGLDKKGKPYDIKYGDLYEPYQYETFIKTGDMYCLFYELGYNLIKPSGTVCYITSNKWMRAGYGEKLRNFFHKKTNPQILIDFGGVQVFESATVDTNIILFSKENNAHKTRSVVVGKDNKIGVFNLSDFVQQNASELSFNSRDSWVILSPIELSIKKKIEAVGVPLKDWDINIYRGVLTGYNEAFIITTDKRDEILANCQTPEERHRTEELIRPILRGRDIKRYGYEWANLWLINTHNGIKGKLDRIHIEDYPAIKSHLDQFWDKISTRADKGDTPYNLRNCAYLDDFNKTQIVWLELTDEPKFTLVNKMVSLNTVFFMTGVHLPHILGQLNSKLITWYFHKCLGARSGVGTNRWLKYTIEQLPLAPYAEEYGEMAYMLSKNYSTNCDEAVNHLTCCLFGLSEAEEEFVNQFHV